MDELTSDGPDLNAIRETRRQIDPYVLETPIWGWRNHSIVKIVGQDTQVILKLELFQHTGTFKPRGALANTAISSGLLPASRPTV